MSLTDSRTTPMAPEIARPWQCTRQPSARRAASAGAHREASALYARALDGVDHLAIREHAELLEEYAWECNPADRCSREAVSLLEPLPAGSALALAYRAKALVHLANRDAAAAMDWGRRAIGVADGCGDAALAARSHIVVGSAQLLVDYEQGCAYLEERLAIELEVGRETHVANALAHLGRRSAELYRFQRAERYLGRGIAYTDGRDLSLFGQYMLAWQSLTLMYLGRWSEAAADAQRVLMRSGMSAANRIPALIALGRLHAREGNAATDDALDEALELARTIGTAETVGAVRAARAEQAWLAGDAQRALKEARADYQLAIREQHAWVAGELAFWRWRAGEALAPPDWAAEPFAYQMRGDWQAAAHAWRRQGCPYETARALADGDAAACAAALAIFQRLGARPAAQQLARRLRAAGSAPVPRGPHATTRADPHNLTPRQVQVLDLLADDLSNADIAARLSISPKTVDHHVSAVLGKLAVHSRRAAAALSRDQRMRIRNRARPSEMWGATPDAIAAPGRDDASMQDEL